MATDAKTSTPSILSIAFHLVFGAVLVATTLLSRDESLYKQLFWGSFALLVLVIGGGMWAERVGAPRWIHVLFNLLGIGAILGTFAGAAMEFLTL